MDYNKMYFPKSEMSQTVPTGNFSPDTYAAYADSFDLSLLPNDGEVPLSPQSELSHSSPISFDYIPATIYHDQPIKTEKSWCQEDNKPPTTADTTILLEQLQKQYQFYPSPLPSPPHDYTGIVFPPSPCPSIEQNFANFSIKQEFNALPPSPPESSGAPSPLSDIKSEPETDTETLIDINSLLEKSLKDIQPKKPSQDHQLLREYLQDTSFQKKHNLKPLALESLIGGLGVRGDIEPVISLALEHAKRDAQATCATLKISSDPQQWSAAQVHAWIRSTVEQFKLPSIDDLEIKFPEDGAALACLTEEEFLRRAPEAGGTIHAQLEIWKLACADGFQCGLNTNPTTSNWDSTCMQSMDISEDEDEDKTPVTASNLSLAHSQVSTKAPTPRTGGTHIHLWQFLKELLASPQIHGTAIRWLDRNKGVFKIEDSVRVAKLWGRRKNRPAMNYDKLSRSIRQYYKKGIMKKTERSQRLVYQFCHPYSL